MMNAKEVRTLSEIEIKERIREEQDQLRELSFKLAIEGRLENPMILRQKRRFVARLKTILKEHQGA